MTVAQPRLEMRRGIISTEKGRGVEMSKTRRLEHKPDRGLIPPIAVALAVKVMALTILYFAFFMPAPPPTPDRSAAAIYGLSGGR
jgi:hypothetical protein